MTGVCLVLELQSIHFCDLSAIFCIFFMSWVHLTGPSCFGISRTQDITRKHRAPKTYGAQAITPLLLGFPNLSRNLPRGSRSCFAGLTCTYLLSHMQRLLLWLHAFVSASPPSCQGWCFWQTGTVICHRIAPSHLFVKLPRSESLPAETRKKRLASTHQSSRRLPSA